MRWKCCGSVCTWEVVIFGKTKFQTLRRYYRHVNNFFCHASTLAISFYYMITFILFSPSKLSLQYSILKIELKILNNLWNSIDNQWEVHLLWFAQLSFASCRYSDPKHTRRGVTDLRPWCFSLVFHFVEVNWKEKRKRDLNELLVHDDCRKWYYHRYYRSKMQMHL